MLAGNHPASRLAGEPAFTQPWKKKKKKKKKKEKEKEKKKGKSVIFRKYESQFYRQIPSESAI